MSKHKDTPEQELRDAVSEYWFRHYMVNCRCSLCGNSGQVNTVGLHTNAGEHIGQIQPCICPNGQSLRYADSQHGIDE